MRIVIPLAILPSSKNKIKFLTEKIGNSAYQRKNIISDGMGFTPLEKATNEVGGMIQYEANGDSQPEVNLHPADNRRAPLTQMSLSARTVSPVRDKSLNGVREQGSLMGFTLVEITVGLLIFSIILGAIYCVLSIVRTSYETSTTQVQIQQEARKAMDKMVIELREADSIDLDIFTGDVSENLIRFDLGVEEIEYSVSENKLNRITGGVTTILANNVENVQFTLSGGDVVKIDLRVEKRTPFNRLLTMDLSSRVLLRN